MFSLSIGRTTTTSKLHIGGWNSQFVLNKYTTLERGNKIASELINWLNLTSAVYW